jgi:hypothetical protein
MDKGKRKHTALLINHCMGASEEKRNIVALQHLTSGRTTTLYDLIAAMQDAARPGEEALIVPTIIRWLRAGRITFRDDMGGLIGEGALS